MATKIQPTTEGGGRKPSDATREKLRTAGKSAWGSLTEEQRAARLANLTKGRQPRTPAPPADDKPPAPPTTSGAPTNPLADTLGAGRADHPRSQGLNGHARTNGHSAPPIFRVPDMPPLELGEPGGGIDELGPSTADAGPAIAVTVDQVATLLGFPFELVALRRGDHWKLRNDERALVAEPLTRKINDNALAARAIGAGGDWAVIVGGLAILITARLAEDNAHAPTSTGARGGAADRSGSSGGPARPADGDRDVDPGPGPGRSVGGRLNGFSVGAAADGGPSAVVAEAPSGPLVQAF